MFQSLSNAIAFSTIILSMSIFYLSDAFNNTKLWSIALLFALMLNYIINYRNSSVVDILKLAEIFFIYWAARSCSGDLRAPNLLMYGIGFVPVLLLLLGGSRVFDESPVRWSYFPNKNTAALFYTAVIFALSVSNTRFKLALQIGVSVLSGKAGILLASLFASILSGAVRFKPSTLIAVAFALIAFAALVVFGTLDRQLTVIGNFVGDISNSGIATIAHSNFTTLSQTRGQDLSAYFRIIHWNEIITFYAKSGMPTWIFGYGGGFTPQITSLHLVPHNDYLKSLVEFGMVPFVFFCGLIVVAIAGLKNRVHRALFLVVAINFFTENLLTNFASMAIMFGYSGLLYNLRFVNVRSARASN